ncbi:cysteine hydrolase family protein [Peribacillus sp. SCS-155]|uniref:cysteine hydrolase family protein n=1 Tax=Peribacillus sedimenti TaxID=3115297 RepID=UPI00390622B8
MGTGKGNKTGLLIIDVQNAMFDHENPIYEAEQLLINLQELINNARASNIPVFYVQHNDEEFETETPEWEIHSSISPQDGDVIIQKYTPDSFHETDLDEQLKAEQIGQIIIAGNQTEYCIDTTTRRAYSLGYVVTLVEDGHRTWDSTTLSARQIINHHNEVLGNTFAKLKKTKDILLAN